MRALPIREKKTASRVTVVPPLNGTDMKILRMMASQPSITVLEIAKELGLSDTTVYRHTSKLTKDGYIKREGSKKSGLWIILSR